MDNFPLVTIFGLVKNQAITNADLPIGLSILRTDNIDLMEHKAIFLAQRQNYAENLVVGSFAKVSCQKKSDCTKNVPDL